MTPHVSKCLKMLRIEAWPEADSCVTEGKEEVIMDPALHEGAQE